MTGLLILLYVATPLVVVGLTLGMLLWLVRHERDLGDDDE